MKHETRNTTEILAWCNTCNDRTRHRVCDRRVGVCLEHEAQGVDADGYNLRQIKAREKREEEEQNPKLF